ncbi:MAG TPA: DUF3048 domain-containing protein [Mycobacteriales bacterium]|nr:DUF3048 domain-containing protein [Mycobacteriales bacterium]
MSRTASRPVIAALATASLLALAACGGHDKKPAAAPSPSATSASPTASAQAAPATCPLLGRPPTKGENRTRPAVAIKIDNVDIARPQTGINHADVIFEETVEGGLTRLFAVFQCESAPVVGPIRSARTSDSDLIQLLKTAVFAYSGANGHVNARILSTPGAVALSYDTNGGLYYRSGSRPAPHNVYSSTSALLKAGLAHSHKLKPPPPLFTYSNASPGGKVVRSIALRWSGFASAGWTWTGSGWNRTQNGSPDVLVGGTRVAVRNVIVMRIQTRYLGLRDVLGNASPDDVVTGQGPVWVFRNGHVIRGHWTRKHANSALRLRTARGRLIPLMPGRTWVELLPYSGSISVSRH